MRFVFVSSRKDEISELDRLSKAAGVSVDFDSTVPMINIPDLDAIFDSIAGYESIGGMLNFAFTEMQIKKADQDMRERGIPTFIIVGRILRDGEDFSVPSTQAELLREIATKVIAFNGNERRIRKIGIHLDHIRPPEQSPRDTLSAIARGLRSTL